MNPDEHAAGVAQEPEIVLPKEGEADPIDLIDDIDDLRKVAKGNRAMANRYKNKAPKVIEVDRVVPVTNPSSDSKPYVINDEVVDLRLEGYSKQEVEWIMKNGGRKELENPNSYTSIAIRAQREQHKAEGAASQTNSTAGLSEIERKYTPEQLATMPLKELEAILPKA